jgi:hypothetical protein
MDIVSLMEQLQDVNKSSDARMQKQERTRVDV